MKRIRDMHNNKLSRVFFTTLALLFVFSLSFHTHEHSDSESLSIHAESHSEHSVKDCSACLLQSSLQNPKTGLLLDNNELGLIFRYKVIEFTLTNSFFNIDRPSRAPPFS
ncbi:MAG: hypothetical protein AAF462_00210 [Thermodesulfobacteriota bacterium]